MDRELVYMIPGRRPVLTPHYGMVLYHDHLRCGGKHGLTYGPGGGGPERSILKEILSFSKEILSFSIKSFLFERKSFLFERKSFHFERKSFLFQ